MTFTHKGDRDVTKQVSVEGVLNLEPITTVQRDALTPALGDRITNSDNTMIEWFNGTDWAPEAGHYPKIVNVQCYTDTVLSSETTTQADTTDETSAAASHIYISDYYLTFKSDIDIEVDHIRILLWNSTLVDATVGNLSIYPGIGTEYALMAESTNNAVITGSTTHHVKYDFAPGLVLIADEIYTLYFHDAADVNDYLFDANLSGDSGFNFYRTSDDTIVNFYTPTLRVVGATDNTVPANTYQVFTVTYDDLTTTQYAVNADDVTDEPDISSGIPVTWTKCSGLSFEKTITSTTPVDGYDIGDTISYELTVSNSSDGDLTDVTMLDGMASDIDVSNLVDPDGLLTGGSIGLSIGETYTASFDYTVEIEDLVTDTVKNFATSSSVETSPILRKVDVSGPELAIPNWNETFETLPLATTGNSVQSTPPGHRTPWFTTFDPGALPVAEFIRIAQIKDTPSGAGTDRAFFFGGKCHWYTEPIDVTDWVGPLHLSYYMRSNGNLESSDFAEFSVSIDGAPEVMLWHQDGPGTIIRTDDYNLQNDFGLPTATSTVQFHMQVNMNSPSGSGSANESLRFFRFKLQADS